MSPLCTAVARLERIYPWPSEAAVAIADWQGSVVEFAGAPQAPSLHAVARYVRRVVRDLAFGDVVVSNDPAVGCADVTQLTLVRSLGDGTAIARVRIPDIGGFALGGLTSDGYDVWGEGARFPALAIVRAGASRPAARKLLLLNSRTPRLLELALGRLEAETGRLTALEPHVAKARWNTQRLAATSALARLRRGVYRAEIDVDTEDRWPKATIRGQLEVRTGGVQLDFSASDSELQAPLNCSRALCADVCAIELSRRLKDFTATPAAMSVLELEPGRGLVSGAAQRAMTGLALVYSAPALSAVVSTLLDHAGVAPAAGPRLQLAPDVLARADPAACTLAADRAAAILAVERKLNAT